MKTSNANWNLYRSFIAVYETRHLPSAADMLGLCRSAVGHNVRELGDQIGAKLFNATPKGVEPTSEAITLYPIAKKAIEMLIECEENVRAFTPESKAILRVAIPSTLASYYFDGYIKSFCRTYPNVRFEFFGKSGIELLAQKKIDFIIDLDYFFKKYDFKTAMLCSFSGTFIASKDFIAAHKLDNVISKETFAALPVIAHREPWADLSNTDGIPQEPFMLTSSTEFAYSMAKNSIGIAYYYKELLEKVNDPDVAAIKIDGVTLPRINIVCAYNNRHLTKPARAFVDGLVKYCATGSLNQLA